MKRRIVRQATTNEFSIKPQDLGFDTETATELTPTSNRAISNRSTTSGTTATPSNSRQNLGIYPGE